MALPQAPFTQIYKDFGQLRYKEKELPTTAGWEPDYMIITIRTDKPPKSRFECKPRLPVRDVAGKVPRSRFRRLPISLNGRHGYIINRKALTVVTVHNTGPRGPLTTIPGSEVEEGHQAKVQRDGSFDSSVIQKSHLRDWNLNTQDVRVQEIRMYQALLLECR